MNFQFVTYKRLADNLENRVKTFTYSNLKTNKRIPWFKAYYRITRFSFQSKLEDRDWRDFYRKLYNRYYQSFTGNDWRIPLERIAYRRYTKVTQKLSKSDITYMCEKVYRVSAKPYGKTYSKKVTFDSKLNLITFSLHKRSVEDLGFNKDSVFHDAIQITINRLYQAYGYKRSLESIALQKINNCK